MSGIRARSAHAPRSTMHHLHETEGVFLLAWPHRVRRIALRARLEQRRHAQVPLIRVSEGVPPWVAWGGGSSDAGRGGGGGGEGEGAGVFRQLCLALVARRVRGEMERRGTRAVSLLVRREG